MEARISKISSPLHGKKKQLSANRTTKIQITTLIFANMIVQLTLTTELHSHLPMNFTLICKNVTPKY